MSKLIYAPTSNLAETSYAGIKDSDQSVNTVYYSIAFTGDGYMYTHGKKFRLFKVDNNSGLQGLSFSITNGTAALQVDGATIGSGSVIQSATDDNIVKQTLTNGVLALSHKTYLAQGGTFGGNLVVPILTVDTYGHITAISNGQSIDVTKVQAQQVSDAGNYYFTGVSNANLQNPVYHTGVYFDNNGALHANSIYSNGTLLSSLFAPLSHTSVTASGSTEGHVTLSDSYNTTDDADAGKAATPKAVALALAAANTYTDGIIASHDSMVFVGTISHTGVIKSHNANVIQAIDDTSVISDFDYRSGWTFRFVTAGTFNGEEVEVGDMLIALNNKGANFAASDWTIIQTNINGALTSASTLSGILYANNSRTIQSLAFGSGILKSDGSSISFVNPNTTWRDIKVKNTSIGTNVLNLLQGSNVVITENNGAVTIGVDTSGIISNGATLSLVQGLTTFAYSPSANASLTIGNKLTLSVENDVYTLQHATMTSITGKLGKITTDGYGHIASIEEVTALKNPNKLTIKDASSNFIEYDGSAASVLKIINGTDISLALSTVSGEVVLTPSITHKYRPISYSATDASTPVNIINTSDATVFNLIGGENVTLSTQDANGQNLPAGHLRINSENTWRAVEAYKFATNTLSRSSIGTAALKFSDDLIWSENELGICWTEIDDEGRITYVK